MKVEILKKCFVPDGSKAPSILDAGSFVELPDEQAQILIEDKYAAAAKAPKAEKPEEPKAEKSEAKAEAPKAEKSAK